MLVSRALLGAAAGLALLYVGLITAYFAIAKPRHRPSVDSSVNTARYEVTTEGGDLHVLDDATGDPGGVLLEAQRRFGEVASVRKLEPGEQATFTEPSGSRRAAPLIAFTLLLFPLGMLIAGLRARRRGANAEALWSALSFTLTADTAQLKRALGISDQDLTQAVAQINQQGRAQLVIDATTQRIYDRRLSDHTITVQFCPRCNDPINVRVIADLQHAPKCPSCLYPVDHHELDRLKAGIVQGLRDRSANADDARFSLVTFTVLALVFPPGAIFYGLRRS